MGLFKEFQTKRKKQKDFQTKFSKLEKEAYEKEALKLAKTIGKKRAKERAKQRQQRKGKGIGILAALGKASGGMNNYWEHELKGKKGKRGLLS